MQGTGRLAAGVQNLLEPLAPPPALSSSCAASALWVRCIPVPPPPPPLRSPVFLSVLQPLWSVPAHRANFSLSRAPAAEVVPLPAPLGACGFHCASIPFCPAAHSPGSPPWWMMAVFHRTCFSPHTLAVKNRLVSPLHSSFWANIFLIFNV